MAQLHTRHTTPEVPGIPFRGSPAACGAIGKQSAEIIHRPFKEGIGAGGRPVDVEPLQHPLGMAHPAHHPAVWGSERFHSEEGTAGVVPDVHAGPAQRVHILGGNLPGGGQRLAPGLSRQEPALPVGDRQAVAAAQLILGEPGGQPGGHAHVH